MILTQDHKAHIFNYLYSDRKKIEVSEDRFFVLGEGILLAKLIWAPTELGTWDGINHQKLVHRP